MRKVQPLVLPFFCEGYDRDVAWEQAKAAAAQLEEMGMEPEEMFVDNYGKYVDWAE